MKRLYQTLRSGFTLCVGSLLLALATGLPAMAQKIGGDLLAQIVFQQVCSKKVTKRMKVILPREPVLLINAAQMA